MTCFIHKPLKHGVDWYRPDSARIGSCNKLHTKCTIQIPWKNQYDIILVSEKQSTLVIKSFDAAVDGGDWSCVDGESASPSWCRKMDPSKSPAIFHANRCCCCCFCAHYAKLISL